MSAYINIKTQEYPYSDAKLYKDNPQISFPKPLTKEARESVGVFKVLSKEPPEINTQTHYLVEVFPKQVDGVYTQQWEIQELDATQVNSHLELAVESKIQSIVDLTQQRLDNFARTRNYDGILSACTYATSQIPKFAAEGQVAVNLRDATWATLYQILEEVQAGQREAPSGFSDIEPLLPPLEWPV